MSINDMIAATPLGPILDRPVGEVIAGLGLPPLPQLPSLPPMPGLPPLPVIDVGQLVKPIVDLLGGFGTGDLSTAEFDPTTIFDGLSTVLETSMSMAQAAMKIGDQLWSGQASMSAIAKTEEAGVDGGRLATQGTGMSIDIQAAAGIVAAGVAALQAVLVATIGRITAAVALSGPAALPVAVSLAGAGLAEASAVVAATRAQLLAPTTHMTVNGAPVPVTGAPAVTAGSSPSPFAMAGTVLDALSPLVSTAGQVPSMVAAPLRQAMTAAGPAMRPAAYETTTTTAGGPAGGRGAETGRTMTAGGGTAPTGGGSGGGGVGVPAVPLGAARPSVPTMVGATEPAAFSPGSGVRTAAVASAPMPASMAPLAAAGAARGAGVSGDPHDIPDYLVTEDNGVRVVGMVPDVAPPVLGADAEAETEPGPDIRLQLGPDLPRS
ncbi:hypothetical protein [Gordonia sp. NPDC003950]